MNNIIEKSNSYDKNDALLIKNSGVVFTPSNICDEIINNLKPKINEIICEPSVGKGIFIFRLLDYFIKKDISLELLVNFVENNLYCYDINEDFIKEFKQLLNNYFKDLGYYKPLNLDKIVVGDFLLSNDYMFDVILGNPPYIRIQNLEDNYLNLLKNKYDTMTMGNVDIYYAFIEEALKCSTRFGFIVPNNFIKNKSGKFLREILNDDLTYLKNFDNEKVFKNISAYTCIIICDKDCEDKIKFQNYESKGDNCLKDLFNYSMSSLATIKDSVYKITNIDDNYCYITYDNIEYKIEKDICKKVYKVTKAKNVNDYSWIIYPYDIEGKIILEEDLKNNYPYAYEYLKMYKPLLMKRDKGKVDKYDSWYAYGRKQGLYKRIENNDYCRILLPLTFRRSSGLHYIKVDMYEIILTLSGFSIYLLKKDLEIFDKIIVSENFLNFLEMRNKTLRGNSVDDKWLTLNITSLKEYKYTIC